jgi:hypothetical protein
LKAPAGTARPLLPEGALESYECLRAAVLRGQAGPDGLGAVVFHGMGQGLAVLASAVAHRPEVDRPPPEAALPSEPAHDRQLVCLLANMVLAVQSRGRHAY